ncbi:MAG TPA: rhodanese-like domain-containing protein [Candidatus Caenarcaniphilales bacterium]
MQTDWGQTLSWTAIKPLIHLKFPQVSFISTAALAAWLAQPDTQKPVLLDTRTEAEYAVSHLLGAHRIAPDTQDVFLELARDTPIVTYCSVGYRSGLVAVRLQAAGYTQVVNLEGSIFQWANEGRPVYQNDQAVRQVHPYKPFWGHLLDQALHAYQPQVSQE